jgi:hypothetical protein
MVDWRTAGCHCQLQLLPGTLHPQVVLEWATAHPHPHSHGATVTTGRCAVGPPAVWHADRPDGIHQLQALLSRHVQGCARAGGHTWCCGIAMTAATRSTADNVRSAFCCCCCCCCCKPGAAALPPPTCCRPCPCPCPCCCCASRYARVLRARANVLLARESGLAMVYQWAASTRDGRCAATTTTPRSPGSSRVARTQLAQRSSQQPTQRQRRHRSVGPSGHQCSTIPATSQPMPRNQQEEDAIDALPRSPRAAEAGTRVDDVSEWIKHITFV